jgi:hypothetical protein
MKLARRGSVYQFREAIPKDLHPIVGASDARSRRRMCMPRARGFYMQVKVEEIFHSLKHNGWQSSCSNRP